MDMACSDTNNHSEYELFTEMIVNPHLLHEIETNFTWISDMLLSIGNYNQYI